MRMKERERARGASGITAALYACNFYGSCSRNFLRLAESERRKAQEKNNRTKNMRNAAAAFFKQRREMRTEFRASEKPFASADTVHRGVGVGGGGVGNWPACHLAHAEQRQVMNGRHSQSSLSYCSHNDNCRHRHSAHCTAHRHFATLKWQELLAKEPQIETAA